MSSAPDAELAGILERSAAGCLVVRHATADGEVLSLPVFHGDVVLITSDDEQPTTVSQNEVNVSKGDEVTLPGGQAWSPGDEEGPTAEAVADCGAADAFAVVELRG